MKKIKDYKTVLLFHCLKCRKHTESKNQKVAKTKKNNAFIKVCTV